VTATTFRKKAGSYWSYTLDGVPRMKGVTTMMKGLGGPPESYFCNTVAGYAADNWDRLGQLPVSERITEMAGAPKQRFGAAAARGTQVHHFAERLAKGEEVIIPDHIRGHVEACVQFLDDYDVQAGLIEAALFSRRHSYAGSADLFGSVQKPHTGTRTRVLLDWKTNAKGPWGSVAFQLAGYRYADFRLSGDGGRDSEELPVPEVDECWAIWLRADGYDVFPMEATPEVHRQLLYIDQCRLADEACRNYKYDALPHPENVRKVRLADVPSDQEVTS
jgi:hypothetical protein